MSDEIDSEYDDLQTQGPNPFDPDDSLASRMEEMNAAALEDEDVITDDGQEDEGSSEIDDGLSDGETRGRKSKHLSDKDGDSNGNESFSRLRLNLSRQSRQLTESEGRVRALEAEVQRLSGLNRSQQARQSDVIELVRDWAISQLGEGVQANDPRVLKAMQDALEDLTIEAHPDAADLVPEYKQRRSERQRLAQERARHLDYQRQLDELKAERLRLSQQEINAAGLGMVSDFVQSNADRLPFLSAANEAGEIDAVRYLWQTAEDGIAQGHFPMPKTAQDCMDILSVLSDKVERHYRSVAEKLSAPLIKGGKMQRQEQTRRTDVTRKEMRGAPPARDRGRITNGRDGKSVVNRGGGGRGTPDPIDSNAGDGYLDDADDLASRFKRVRRGR